MSSLHERFGPFVELVKTDNRLNWLYLKDRYDDSLRTALLQAALRIKAAFDDEDTPEGVRNILIKKCFVDLFYEVRRHPNYRSIQGIGINEQEIVKREGSFVAKIPEGEPVLPFTSIRDLLLGNITR